MLFSEYCSSRRRNTRGRQPSRRASQFYTIIVCLIMNDADSVMVKLAEVLRRSEDLDKIPALKAEFTRKKVAADSQLKLISKEQLKMTQTGMGALNGGHRTLNLIKEEMIKVDRLCAEAQSMIRDFPHINLVAQTHRNFAQVEEMVTSIDQFEGRLDDLVDLLREDDQAIESQPNLLAIHYGLTKLRDVRDVINEQAKSTGDSCLELINNLQLNSGSTLQEYFARLEDIIEWFNDHVGTACMQLIDLVKSGNNRLVVKLAIVIDEEEKRDKKAKALRDAQNEYKDLASRFTSIAAGPKEHRGYKEKFLEAIELAAQNQIDESDEIFLDDPARLEKSVRWYFNDLNTVKLGMTTLMPKKWRTFKTYVNIYHKLMHDWLVRRIDDKEITPSHILAIIHWCEKYYAKMAKLGIQEEELQPHLIDDRETELVHEYRQLIFKAVEEWMERMATADKQNFLERREEAYDFDANGYFRTKTLGDMWQMLEEQLTVTKSSNRADVADGVVGVMFRSLRSRQTMWERLVDDELQQYVNGADDLDRLQLLQEWLVTIANDQIICIDDAEEYLGQPSPLKRFQRSFDTMISSEFENTSCVEIVKIRDRYVDLGTHCITVFVKLIFVVDFKSLLSEFFTASWYQSRGMSQAISTFEDYLKDFWPRLHPSLADILVEELSDELLAKYLTAVRNRGVKFRRTDPFKEKIKDDVLTVFGFFERFDPFLDIKQKWRAVDGLVKLLEANKEAISNVFEQLKTDYWDLQIGWVEAVLRSRDDYERSMMNAVQSRATELYIERGTETIMSKVK